MRLLIVEDDKHRVDAITGWVRQRTRIVWAKSAGMAIGLLNRDRGRVYDGIMIDYNLHKQKITGQDKLHHGLHVVDAIVRNVDNDVPIFVHSSNIKNGPVMAQRLRGAGFAVDAMPFYGLKEHMFEEWFEYVQELA